MTSRLLVLCWHNVEGTWCFPSRPGWGSRGLASQLASLRAAANVVALTEALDRLREGRALPPRAVALTFDDGYADNLRLAVPMLERFGLPATFFLVPGLLSAEVDAWWETTGWAFATATSPGLSWEGRQYPLSSLQERRSAYTAVAEELKRRDRRDRESAVDALVALLQPFGDPPGPGLYLDWGGAAALVARGFAVGSHTLWHAILAEEAPDEQEADLTRSRQLLTDRLGTGVDVLAYPNGTARDYTAATITAAQRAGYRFAVTTLDGRNDAGTPPYEIRRCVVYPQRGPADLLLAMRATRRGPSHARDGAP